MEDCIEKVFDSVIEDWDWEQNKLHNSSSIKHICLLTLAKCFFFFKYNLQIQFTKCVSNKKGLSRVQTSAKVSAGNYAPVCAKTYAISAIANFGQWAWRVHVSRSSATLTHDQFPHQVLLCHMEVFTNSGPFCTKHRPLPCFLEANWLRISSSLAHDQTSHCCCPSIVVLHVCVWTP